MFLCIECGAASDVHLRVCPRCLASSTFLRVVVPPHGGEVPDTAIVSAKQLAASRSLHTRGVRVLASDAGVLRGALRSGDSLALCGRLPRGSMAVVREVMATTVHGEVVEDDRGGEDEGDEFLVPDFYTNSTGVEVGLFDVSLSIAVASAALDDREELAIVRMSPQHALVVTDLLMKCLADYENMHGGPMPLRSELLKSLEIEDQVAAIRQLGAAKAESAKVSKGERK
jgi:hypothetical protein